MSAFDENVKTASNIGQLANMLLGNNASRKISGGTTTSTKQTILTEDAINALIRGMLDDSSTGLAKVASGGRQAGIYNSTTQQQLTNDLISKAAAQAALGSAKTVTSTTTPATTQTESAKGNLSTMLPILGATMLFRKGEDGKSAFDTLSSSISGFLGAGDGADSDFGAALQAMATEELRGLGTTEGASLSLGSLLSTAAEDAGTGLLTEIAGSAGDLITGAYDFGKDLYDEAADFVSGLF